MVKASQRGFTLIELVVVIVILGILSAFAVPRFMGLEKQARAASVESLEGSIRSAASLAHSVWLANGADDASITVEGQTINITHGYPALDSIDDTLQDTTGFSYNAATGVFSRSGAPAATASTCQVSYAAPTAANLAPTIAGPSDGC